jgi:hypothetical protein
MADAKQQLVVAIRHWIHMDNLAESFKHQEQNASALRNKHEAEAIALMKEIGCAESVIQVSGATLRIDRVEPTSSPPNTWKPIDQTVQAWAARNGMTRTQAHDLLRTLHDKVGERTVMRETLCKEP